MLEERRRGYFQNSATLFSGLAGGILGALLGATLSFMLATSSSGTSHASLVWPPVQAVAVPK
jgi:hypothetical protein